MKSYKKIMVCFIAICMILGMTQVTFSEDIKPKKEETVYAILNYTGEVDNVYVVNSFDLDKATVITDYGDYSSVRNLTTTDEVEYSGGAFKINAPVGKLYYQGNSNLKEVPWDISLSYKLNNNLIKAEDLVGKSGQAELTISIKQNKEITGNFFEKFALQISMNLDTKKFKNIEAEGAALANSGQNKIITITHLPDSEKSYTIRAEVSDFEMAPIQFNGVVLVMNTEFDGISEMTGEFTKLTKGIGDLAEGSKKLETGSGEFKKGVETFADSTKELANASSQIGTGLTQTAYGMSDLMKNSAQLKNIANALMTSKDPQIQAFAKGYLSQMAAIEQLSAGLSNLSDRYTQFNGGVGQLSQGAVKISDSYGDIHNGIISVSKGNTELKNKTASLASDVNTKINEALTQYKNSDYVPVSFVSAQNTNVSAVQFVMRTAALEHAKVQKPIEAEKKPLNFWQRLLKLFGLYHS